MGKKGKKKKGNSNCPIDVQRFMETREYWLLDECVKIQESLPFVAMDVLDDLAFKKVARFLNMAGLLAEHLQVKMIRDCRFNYHHKYLAPKPQFFPFGFDVNVIRAARQVQENPSVSYNGNTYHFPEELRTLSEKFLKDVDSYMTKIASEIEPRIKDFFASGLRRFKLELKEDLEVFDDIWIKFETEYVKANHTILSQVFKQIDKLITIELLLTQAEDRLDIEAKQKYENQFVATVEELTNTLVPDTKGEAFDDDVIPLAEACIFYETKCAERWLHLAKYLIKDYLELRVYIANIPEERLNPQLNQNAQLMRLLKTFHSSVIAARESLAFVVQLPKLIHAKTENWMTKRLLDPDLKYIQKTAHLGAETQWLACP